MQWQAKAALQAVLSRVPAGSRLYRKLQDVSGSARFNLEDQYSRKRNFLKRVQAQGLPIKDCTFLEIGTGWHPVLPILLFLQGARKTVTIDINPWMTPASLEETLAGLAGIGDRIAADFDINAAACRICLQDLLDRCRSGEPMFAILERANIQYKLGVDACRTDFADNEFDYTVSCNLLEHVPPDVIRGMLRESARILKPNGLHLHHINPGDHYAETAPQITTANLVKYSERQWYWIGGSGLAYHNRLRGVDFVRLFESEGQNVVYRRDLVDPPALEALRRGRLKPHQTFADYSHEELATHLIDIFARPHEAAGERPSEAEAEEIAA